MRKLSVVIVLMLAIVGGAIAQVTRGPINQQGAVTAGNVGVFVGNNIVKGGTASEVLDGIGSTRGSVLYRGASGWAALTPGTSGNVLTSKGAGADPVYEAAAGGGYTDEQAQDAVGGILVDANTIDLTYNDATPSITAATKLYGVRVKKAADHTTANYTTETFVAFDSEDFDVGGWHDNVTNNSRITVPAGVTYIEVTIGLHSSNDTADRWHNSYIRKNGTELIASGYGNEAGAASYGITLSTGPIAVTAGDYFEFSYQTESDTSITVFQQGTFLAATVLQ